MKVDEAQTAELLDTGNQKNISSGVQKPVGSANYSLDLIVLILSAAHAIGTVSSGNK